MKLIFLHGMPGVGKLTVARALAEVTGFGVFHNHLTVDLVSSVFDFGTEPFVKLRERIWLDVFREAAKAKVNGLIFTFAFEPTVAAGFVDRVRSIIETEGGEVLFVKLVCSAEELERRVVAESRQSLGKISDLKLFRELNDTGTFADPGVTENRLVLDVTSLKPEDAARQIARELGLA